MNTAIAERTPTADAIEQVLIGGDLSRLTSEQRVSYYNRVCESLGLNPLTKPFAYLKLNGKEILYALRDAAEQLRKLHGVSIVAIESAHVGDVFVVTAKAQDKTGRTDASTGAVALGGLKGEALANALMKAETKAKRRVTLSICGLGMLDETEVETIPPSGYTVTAPARSEVIASAAPASVHSGVAEHSSVVAPSDGPAASADSEQSDDDGYLYVERVDRKPTRNQNVTKFVVVLSDGREVSTIKTQLGDLAEQLCQEGAAVVAETSSSRWGENLDGLRRDYPEDDPDPAREQLGDDDTTPF